MVSPPDCTASQLFMTTAVVYTLGHRLHVRSYRSPSKLGHRNRIWSDWARPCGCDNLLRALPARGSQNAACSLSNRNFQLLETGQIVYLNARR
jgi:hypothetical protein